jgi:hypothetical protein
MDKRKQVGDIWYAAQGHRLRQRSGCCLWNVFVFVMILFALRTCVG